MTTDFEGEWDLFMQNNFALQSVETKAAPSNLSRKRKESSSEPPHPPLDSMRKIQMAKEEEDKWSRTNIIQQYLGLRKMEERDSMLLVMENKSVFVMKGGSQGEHNMTKLLFTSRDTLEEHYRSSKEIFVYCREFADMNNKALHTLFSEKYNVQVSIVVCKYSSGSETAMKMLSDVIRKVKANATITKTKLLPSSMELKFRLSDGYVGKQKWMLLNYHQHLDNSFFDLHWTLLTACVLVEKVPTGIVIITKKSISFASAKQFSEKIKRMGWELDSIYDEDRLVITVAGEGLQSRIIIRAH